MSGETSAFSAFVQAAKDRGLADEFIVELLRQNGWSERRVYRAYSAYYAEELGMALPARPLGSGGARDAFFYLLNFITLGFWTVALGQIFFMLVARAFPDPVRTLNDAGGSLRDQISFQLATVIVSFPIFVLIHARIQRDLRSRPDMYESPVRRWLTYVALVFAALIVLGDAIWVIDALITGALTARFILDALVLLVLGGGVFVYYLRTIDPPAATS